ncbi:DsbA family protein [Fluoribacter gormanii]|uniref:DsbA family protein n=1 Tax=Fluoribacter gormanii TaxID=464 RepID=UPI001041B607|nr:DsbA family protein [Fluoribacter gormanii]
MGFATTSRLLIFSMIFSSNIFADNSITPNADKIATEKIIHDYLISNPEVLIEASKVLQQKQQTKMQQQAKSAIQENAEQLFKDNGAGVGSSKGNVTVVEFFDYQCGHCKKMVPVLNELLKDNSQLRVIYKEFPIFGDKSTLAARAALAAGMQNKYKEMHDLLFNQEDGITQDKINAAAKALGLNMKKFDADMNSKEVSMALESNSKLAEKLHLMGTPAIIIASTPDGQFKQGSEPVLIPGEASKDTLLELINKAGS